MGSQVRILPPRPVYSSARVVELVVTADSKSAAARRVGSSPTPGTNVCGSVAERLIATVLKTVIPRGIVSSNLTASAKDLESWMSGLNRHPAKVLSVVIRTVGSNPTLSAKDTPCTASGLERTGEGRRPRSPERYCSNSSEAERGVDNAGVPGSIPGSSTNKISSAGQLLNRFVKRI